MLNKKPLYKNPYLQFIFFGLCLCVIPWLASIGVIKNSWVTLIGSVVIYTVAALGLNLLLGYAGLISLGTAGFMGLAAYITAYVTMDMGLIFWVGLLVAVVASVLIGIIVGLTSLRIEGLYLGIVTLCVAEILKKTFEELGAFTNGYAGKKATFPEIFGGVTLNRDTTYILLVILMVLSMILLYNIVNGQLGRALHAMRGSQVAAQAMGVNITKYRLIAFAIATGYAALSGVMYVHFIKYSYPTTWALILSLNLLAAVVVGGLRSIYGSFLGSLIIFALPDLLLKRIPVIGSMNGFAYIFSGVLLIVIVLGYPRGLISVFGDIKRKFKGKKKAATCAQAVALEEGEAK